QIRRQPEFVQQPEFEGENGLRLRRLFGQVIQQVHHQSKHYWQGRFSLGGLLDEGGAVTGLLKINELLAQGSVGRAQQHLAQRVQFRAPAAREAEVGEIEQI